MRVVRIIKDINQEDTMIGIRSEQEDIKAKDLILVM